MIKKFKFWVIAFLGIGIAFAASEFLPNEPINNNPVVATIDQQLEGKNATEKAAVKSEAISKLKLKGQYKKDNIKVEIISDITQIEINGQHGIEFFAKAWKDGKPLGFGKDGSVETERFRIFNPPILVDDPNGKIIREWQEKDTDGNITTKQRKLREDPAEAIKQVLFHNVSLVGKENTQIIAGSIGNTTSTFYPDADPESTSFDGVVATWDAIPSRTVWSVVWADTHGDFATSNFTNLADAGHGIGAGIVKYGGGEWSIVRVITLFDTSAIGSGATISSATLSVYGNYILDNENDTESYIGVVTANPASNTNIVNTDIDDFGTTEQHDTDQRADLTTFSVVAYTNFSLNATGLGNISKTGITKFGLREGHDIQNSAPGFGGNSRTQARCYAVDYTGTANDPKLVVVHETAAVVLPSEESDLIIWEE